MMRFNNIYYLAVSAPLAKLDSLSFLSSESIFANLQSIKKDDEKFGRRESIKIISDLFNIYMYKI